MPIVGRLGGAAGWADSRLQGGKISRGFFFLMAEILNRVLPEGSALRDFVEVGSMLAAGVAIGLLCSRCGRRARGCVLFHRCMPPRVSALAASRTRCPALGCAARAS